VGSRDLVLDFEIPLISPEWLILQILCDVTENVQTSHHGGSCAATSKHLKGECGRKSWQNFALFDPLVENREGLSVRITRATPGSKHLHSLLSTRRPAIGGFVTLGHTN